VTGASKGIRRSNCQALAAEGAAVVVNYASSKEGADRVVAEIAGKGGKAVAVQADLAKPADVTRLFAETKKGVWAPGYFGEQRGIYEFALLEAITEEHFTALQLECAGRIAGAREALKLFGPEAEASSTLAQE